MTATSTASPTQTDDTKLAFQILRLGFTAAPILFGLDKFVNVMVDWGTYLPDFLSDQAGLVMAIVGVIEIVAGIGVWLRPKIFANVVAAWLGLIIVTLIIAGGFLDVALRDFGLLLGALALGQLARVHA